MCFALFGGASVRAEEPATIDDAPIKVKTLDELEQLRQRSSAQRWGRGVPAKASVSNSKSVEAASKKSEADETADEPESSEPKASAPEKAARVSIGESFSEPPLPYGMERRPTKPAPMKPAPMKPVAAKPAPLKPTQPKIAEAKPAAAKPASAKPGKATVATTKSSGVTRVSQAEDQPKLPAPGGAPAPLPNPPGNPIPTEQAPAPFANDPDRISSPSQLKGVDTILPYSDYEPDPVIAATDPCRNQCPRPGTCGPGEAQLCPEELWQGGPYIPRMFEGSCFTWAASNLYHNPLYFEDDALERYGHTYGCVAQPFASVARASAQLALLPYQMGVDPPCSIRYALGFYRPGDCAPKLCYQIPLSVRGALVEGAAVTGLVFLLP